MLVEKIIYQRTKRANEWTVNVTLICINFLHLLQITQP